MPQPGIHEPPEGRTHAWFYWPRLRPLLLLLSDALHCEGSFLFCRSSPGVQGVQSLGPTPSRCARTVLPPPLPLFPPPHRPQKLPETGAAETWLRARCLMHTLSSAAAGVRAQRPPELSIPSTLSFCEVASDMGLVPWGASQEGSEPSTTRPGRPRKGELPDLKMWVPSSQPQRMHLAMKQAHL